MSTPSSPASRPPGSPRSRGSSTRRRPMADGSTGFGPAVLDVTVVLLDDGFSSTAVMPIEIFHSAGALWRILQGKAPEPRFRVTIASLDGAAVTSPYGLRLSPQASIGQIERT